jgi:hypothetical protein
MTGSRIGRDQTSPILERSVCLVCSATHTTAQPSLSPQMDYLQIQKADLPYRWLALMPMGCNNRPVDLTSSNLMRGVVWRKPPI